LNSKYSIIKLITKNSPQHTLSTCYKERYIEEAVNTKFLGLQIDNHLNWKNHSNQLVPKLSGACCALRSMSHISSTETLKSIYFAYFHSIMKCGIIFYGNSHNSRKIFTVQKKIIRIMASVKTGNSRRSLFKRLEVLTLPCEYIFLLMNFRVNNQEYFQTNSALHSVNTRNRHDLHIRTANLSCFQKNASLLWHQNLQQSTIVSNAL
jgi:hypothetical protein